MLQEPLSLPPSFTQFTALPVKAGEVIALTVPTWAPVLSYNLSTSKFSYRQSRRANCTHAAGSQTAQRTVGEAAVQVQLHGYAGRVQGDRGSQHAVPKKYVHGPRR